LARVLPVIALLLIGVGVYVSRGRRRALVAAGLSVPSSMILLGGTLSVFRQFYLDAVPADQLPHDAAASIYDTLVHFIRLHLRPVPVILPVVGPVGRLTRPAR